jgi:putative hydrolase of the HAD superfamily
MIIFDLDDTLINTSHLFYEVREKFINLVSDSTSSDKVREAFEGIDDRNIKLFGYNPWRYTISMIQSLQYMAVRSDELDISSSRYKEVISIGSRIKKDIPPLINGAKKVLNDLQEENHLILVTRGEKELQKRKIEYHGLSKYFSRIEIVPSKSVDLFSKISSRSSLKNENVWSVGDSPKWDIEPALDAGLNAILVEYTHPKYEWAHDNRCALGSLCVPSVKSITDLPDKLSQIRT